MIRNVVAHLKTLWRRGGQEREGNMPAAPKPAPMAMRHVDDQFLVDNPIHVSRGSAFNIRDFYDQGKSMWRRDLNVEDAWKVHQAIMPATRAEQRLLENDPGAALRDMPLPAWMRPANEIKHLPPLAYTDEVDTDHYGKQVGARMQAAFNASSRLSAELFLTSCVSGESALPSI